MRCVTIEIDSDSFQSDPNDYSDEDFMINDDDNYAYNYCNFDDHIHIQSPFVEDPFPELDYCMIDADIIMDNILDHVEGVVEQGNRHVCHYCCSWLNWFHQ